jgi:hypothetical protein
MGTAAPLIVAYRRGGGQRPPPDRETLTILADGTFVMWRSIASATYPPTAVGRFAGILPVETVAALKSEIDAAQTVGFYQLRSSPDSAAETIEIGQTRADLGTNNTPANAWGPLVARLRGFLLELVQFPQAALALTAAPDGQQVQLVRQGDQPLRIDLSAVTLHAALWKPAEYVTLKEWTGESANLGGIVTTTPGWTLDIPISAGFTIVKGSAVHASATLRLFDSEVPVDVALST